MDVSQLTNLYKEYASFAWSRVEYWIGLTTATLAANFVAGDSLEPELRIMMVLLYSGFSAISYFIWVVGILRVREIGRDIKDARKRGEDSSHIGKATSTSMMHFLTVLVGSTFYILGWFGTIAYILDWPVFGG